MSLVKLLSIDGGGIRGLAALVVLEQLMDAANEERQQNGLDRQEPWQMFDLIGGTSTGGLIAIMLGRLRMSFKDCKEAYINLSRRAFTPKNIIAQAVQLPGLGPKFKTKPLEDAIKEVIESARGYLGVGPDEALLKEDGAACKVFVVSHLENISGRTAIFRSYRNIEKPRETFDTMKIWQACRGTSAATTFFEQLKIGEDVFSDGGLLYNNPVALVHAEGSEVFRGRETLLISLGTGIATDKVYDPNIITVASQLADLATRTQGEADNFIRRDGAERARSKRYFRFDIPGIGDIAMDEAKQLNKIKLASEKYLDDPEVGIKIRACSEQLAEGINSATLNDLHRSLVTYAQNPREAAILSPHEDTFKWLWTETGHGFVRWLKSEDTAYWISGMPGSGKSTLMKFIVKHSFTGKHLGMLAGDRINALFSYFFDEMSELSTPQEKSIEGLLHALLNFLLEFDSRLARNVMNIYNTKVLRHGLSNASKPTPMWSIECLKEALMSICGQKLVQGKICLFIDGLDECQGQQDEYLKFLLSWMDNMRQGVLQVKFCLATRDIEDFSDQLKNYPRLEVNQWTNKDIQSYVRDKLNDALRKSISLNTSSHSSAHNRLIQSIVSKAHGVFIWVKLVVADLVTDLEDGKEEADLQLRLNTLPRELESLYGHIIEEIPAKDLATADKFFRLLLRAPGEKCTLTLLQFLLAAQNPNDAITCDVKYEVGKEYEMYMLEKLSLIGQRARSRCRNLVQVRTRRLAETRWDPLRRENITFIHLTLKKYVSKPEVKQKIADRITSTGSAIIREVDTLLMASCLRLIKTQASCLPHWASGARQIQQGSMEAGRNTGHSQTIQSQTTFFDEEDQVDDGEYNEEICRRAPDNCITKFFNYAQNVETFLGLPQTKYIDELNSVLLQADPDWASKFYFHRTLNPIPTFDVLCLAICCKLELFVKEKLTPHRARKKRTPPLLFYAMNPPGWTYEPANMKMMRILIDAGVRLNEIYMNNENEQTIWGHTLYHYLCVGTNHPAENWEQIVQLMLESGADANQKVFLRGEKYTRALHLLVDQYQKVPVARKGEVKRGIRLLLKHNAGLELENSEGVTVIEYASDAKGQILDIIEKMAERENRRSQNSRTAMTTRSAALFPNSENAPRIINHDPPMPVERGGELSSRAPRSSSKRRQSTAEMNDQEADHHVPKVRRQRNQNAQARESRI